MNEKPDFWVRVVRKEDASYPVFVSESLESLKCFVEENFWLKRVAVVTDSNVWSLYGDLIRDALSCFDFEVIVFPAGEKNKTRETKERIEDEMLGKNFGRDSVVVAFGGGVVGDVAGFVAATYTRGIPFVQVPTTLLAAVDSSVGGKVGVDTPFGKNMIGAFHQPEAVVIDLNVFSSLSDVDVKNGFAEMIKHGIISDERYFRFIKDNKDKLWKEVKSGKGKNLKKAILGSVKIKSAVVEKDEKESGLRRILNFGHTVGHAVELMSDYSVPHGSAVAFGMSVESLIAEEKTGLSEKEALEIIQTIIDFGFNLSDGLRFEPADVYDAMKTDKKNEEGRVKMALPKKIGRMMDFGGAYAGEVKFNEFESAWKKLKHLFLLK